MLECLKKNLKKYEQFFIESFLNTVYQRKYHFSIFDLSRWADDKNWFIQVHFFRNKILYVPSIQIFISTFCEDVLTFIVNLFCNVCAEAMDEYWNRKESCYEENEIRQSQFAWAL